MFNYFSYVVATGKMDPELPLIALTRNGNTLVDLNHRPCDAMAKKRIPTKLSPLNNSEHHGENHSVEEKLEAETFQPKVPDQLGAKGSHVILDYGHDIPNRTYKNPTKMHLWGHLFLFLSTTSFHGLPFLAGSRKMCKLYWVILFFVVLVLTAITTALVALHYAEMNKIFYSRLQFNKRLKFPAITICNLNLYRKSVFTRSGIDNLDDLIVFFN